jgi:hypothetical protein
VYQSISHTHSSAFYNTPNALSSHEHKGFDDLHHEHNFHVGILHFLGHLFEGIDYSKEFVDKHFIVFQKSSARIAVNQDRFLNSFICGFSEIELGVHNETLTSSFFYSCPTQKLFLPGKPARAPPSLV